MTEVNISSFDWSVLLWWLVIAAVLTLSTVVAHKIVNKKVKLIHEQFPLEPSDKENTPKETTGWSVVIVCVVALIGFFVAISVGSYSDEEKLRKSLHQATSEQVSVIGVPQRSDIDILFGAYHGDEPEIEYVYDDNTQFTFNAITLPEQKKILCKVSNTSGKHLVGCVKNGTKDYVSVQEAIDAAPVGGKTK